jgi:hypothetical protein
MERLRAAGEKSGAVVGGNTEAALAGHYRGGRSR